MSPWTARGVLPCTSCLAPAQARQLPLARPQGSRKRVQGCRAAYGEHGAGGGRPSPSPPAHLHQELTVLREQRQRAAHRLQHLVAQEAYAAAAEERDALQQLELRERMLELAEAAEVKQEAGVVHCLGAVIQHRRYGYRGVIFGFDTRWRRRALRSCRRPPACPGRA